MVLHIPLGFMAGASSLDDLMLYSGHSLGWVLPFCRDVVGVFYCAVFSLNGYMVSSISSTMIVSTN